MIEKKNYFDQNQPQIIMKKKETSTAQGGKATPSKPEKFTIDKKATVSSSRRGKVMPD